MKNKIVLFALLALPMAAMANEDPLDNALDSCMNRANTTQQMVLCQDAAVKRWDKAMNQAYQKAMAPLNDEQKTKLRDAQRNWLKYRDSWIAVSKALGSQGTLASVGIIAQQVSLTRDQTLMLRSLSATNCANPADCGQ